MPLMIKHQKQQSFIHHNGQQKFLKYFDHNVKL